MESATGGERELRALVATEAPELETKLGGDDGVGGLAVSVFCGMGLVKWGHGVAWFGLGLVECRVQLLNWV